MSRDPFSTLVDALESHGCGPSNGKAKCPAHDDRLPSLTYRQAADRVLWRCHAGCSQGSVLDALGLAWAAMFDGDGGSVARKRNAPLLSPDERMRRALSLRGIHWFVGGDGSGYYGADQCVSCGQGDGDAAALIFATVGGALRATCIYGCAPAVLEDEISAALARPAKREGWVSDDLRGFLRLLDRASIKWKPIGNHGGLWRAAACPACDDSTLWISEHGDGIRVACWGTCSERQISDALRAVAA